MQGGRRSGPAGRANRALGSGGSAGRSRRRRRRGVCGDGGRQVGDPPRVGAGLPHGGPDAALTCPSEGIGGPGNWAGRLGRRGPGCSSASPPTPASSLSFSGCPAKVSVAQSGCPERPPLRGGSVSPSHPDLLENLNWTAGWPGWGHRGTRGWGHGDWGAEPSCHPVPAPSSSPPRPPWGWCQPQACHPPAPGTRQPPVRQSRPAPVIAEPGRGRDDRWRRSHFHQSVAVGEGGRGHGMGGWDCCGTVLGSLQAPQGTSPELRSRSEALSFGLPPGGKRGEGEDPGRSVLSSLSPHVVVSSGAPLDSRQEELSSWVN